MKVDEKNIEEKTGKNEPLLEEKAEKSNESHSMFDPSSEPP